MCVRVSLLKKGMLPSLHSSSTNDESRILEQQLCVFRSIIRGAPININSSLCKHIPQFPFPFLFLHSIQKTQTKKKTFLTNE